MEINSSFVTSADQHSVFLASEDKYVKLLKVYRTIKIISNYQKYTNISKSNQRMFELFMKKYGGNRLWVLAILLVVLPAVTDWD